jgi:hypothetical protein
MYNIIKNVTKKRVKAIIVSPNYVLITYVILSKCRYWCDSKYREHRYTIVLTKDENNQFVAFRTDFSVLSCNDMGAECDIRDYVRLDNIDIEVISNDSWVYSILGYRVDVKDHLKNYEIPIALENGKRMRVQGDLIVYNRWVFDNLEDFKYSYLLTGGMGSVENSIRAWFTNEICKTLDSIGVTYDRGVFTISIPIPYYYIRRYENELDLKLRALVRRVDQKILNDILGFEIRDSDILIQFDRVNNRAIIRVEGVYRDNPLKFREYITNLGVLDKIPVDIYSFNIGKHVIEYRGLPRFIEFSVSDPIPMVITVDFRNTNIVYVTDWLKFKHPEHGEIELEVTKPSSIEIYHVSRLSNDLLIRNARILLSL